MKKSKMIFAISIFLPALANAQFFGSVMQTQNPCGVYQGMLKSAGFNHNWKLNEKTGTVAVDSISTNTGTYVNSPSANASGPFYSSSGSRTLNGTNQEVQTSLYLTNPQSITIMIWFKTTVAGGKLIGLGNSQSGISGQYDRHLYMTSSGQIVFGVWNGGDVTITSTGSYADNRWHLAAGTLGAAGMQLVIDGQLAGTNANTSPGCCDGYWRIGSDALNGWPGATANIFFTGILADAAVSDTRQVSLAQLQQLYATSKKCRVDSSGSLISITSATYGTSGQTCDATAPILAVCNGLTTCAFQSDNNICGDPASGFGKQLIVNYKCNGTAKSVSASENTIANIDCP